MFGKRREKSTNLLVWIFFMTDFGMECEMGVETGSTNCVISRALPVMLFEWDDIMSLKFIMPSS